MKEAVLVLDMDFFTKPVYAGSFYEKRDFLNPIDFKGTAKNWMTLDDFLYKMNFLYKIRGSSVGRDHESIYFIQRMIDVHYLFPKKFEIVMLDAHHDSYMYHDKKHYDSCPITEFRDWDWLLGAFKFQWVNEVTWVYPDYLEPKETLHPEAFTDINVTINPVKWSHFKPNTYDWKYFNLVLNKDMAVYNDKMLKGILQHIQVF
jgi:hypothetical protein